MANATTTKTTVIVTLTLTEEEAGTIRTICGNVGGCPINSPRRYMDNIDSALSQAGVRRHGNVDRGDIYFRDDK